MAWPALGMNYGHQATHNPYSATQISADLGFLRAMGVAKLRIAFPTFDAGGISAIQSLVQTALSMGFYVVWGATSSGGTPVSSSRWASFKNYVLTTLAPWAQAQQNPSLELSIGNEEELHCDGTTLTVATVVSDLAALASTVQGIYTFGPVSYQASIGFLSNWATNGLGGLDRIGFNAYALGPVSITAHATNIVNAFPSQGYLSEWGTPNGYNDFANEALFATVIDKQLRALKTTAIPDAYYFCFRDGSFGLPSNAWAIKKTDDNWRQAAPALFSSRAWFKGSPNNAVQRSPASRLAGLPRAPTATRPNL